jgi:hypothetical protein
VPPANGCGANLFLIKNPLSFIYEKDFKHSRYAVTIK